MFVNASSRRILTQVMRIGAFIIDAPRPVHQGGMARIYRGHVPGTDTPVALKVACDDPDSHDALKFEADILQSLSHPNIVRILPITMHPNQDKDYYIARAMDLPGQPWYIALEYLEGGNLRQRLLRNRTLPVKEAAEWAIQIARAIQYMASHNVVHLDIKPENIMFRRPWGGQQQEAVIVDFGISRRLKHGVIPRAGSLRYTSPEHLHYAQGTHVEIDSRADLYSLGVVLYEMLCGDVPFSGRSEHEIAEAILRDQVEPPSLKNPSVSFPPAVEDLVMQALRKNPAERMTVDRFLKELEDAVPNRAVPAEAA